MCSALRPSSGPIPNCTLASIEARVWQRHWTEGKRWLEDIARGSFVAKDTILCRWVASCGGYIEGQLAFLPWLPYGPARDALVGALLAHGIAARIGAAKQRPDFGAELRAHGVAAAARLAIRFVCEGLTDRGHERVVTGRVNEGGAFGITIVTAQTEAEVLALHRAGGLRVEGSLCPHKNRDAAVPILGVILGAAS